MGKWKAVKVKQELVDQVREQIEKTEHKGLSDFVSEAIQLRLQTLAKQRVTEYLERDRAARTPQMQAQLLYSPKHTWARTNLEGTVEIGITDYFRGQLKEIVNVRTGVVGETVSKDEPFGVAESWWFTYDLHAPLDGCIVSINEEVVNDPFILNADTSTWILKVRPESQGLDSWTDGLLDSQQYKELAAKPRPTAGQPSRL